MYSRPTDLPTKASPLVEVLPDVKAPNTRNIIDDYRVTQFLLWSTILLTDIEAINVEGEAFQIHDSWDSLLWISDDLLSFFDLFQIFCLVLY